MLDLRIITRHAALYPVLSDHFKCAAVDENKSAQTLTGCDLDFARLIYCTGVGSCVQSIIQALVIQFVS